MVAGTPPGHTCSRNKVSPTCPRSSTSTSADQQPDQQIRSTNTINRYGQQADQESYLCQLLWSFHCCLTYHMRWVPKRRLSMICAQYLLWILLGAPLALPLARMVHAFVRVISGISLVNGPWTVRLLLAKSWRTPSPLLSGWCTSGWDHSSQEL